MIIVHTNIGKCPVPPGWAIERVVQILKECGHKVLKVEETDKRAKRAG